MARRIKGIESKLIHSGEPEPLHRGRGDDADFPVLDLRDRRRQKLPRPALHPAQQHAQPRRAASQARGAGECRSCAGDWQRDGGDFLDAADDAGRGRASARAKLPLRRDLRPSHQRFSASSGTRWISSTRTSRPHGARWSARDTRAIYVESISNPLLQVPDLEAAVDFARRHGLVSIIDNTFASPINFRPAEIGLRFIDS